MMAGLTDVTSPTKPRSPSRSVAVMSPASSPDSPTAIGPWTLIADTMSRLTLPTSTMRAMSSVSASVTRRPSRNSLSLPRRAMSSPIWGPPPCTTTGRMPTGLQQHDVLGEAVGQLGVDHGVAAVLDHDGRAEEPPDVGQRLDEHAGPLVGVGQHLGVPSSCLRRVAHG